MGERKSRRETSMCERYIEHLLHTPNWGPGPQPRHVPWLGIEPVIFQSVGQCPPHWATPARARQILLKQVKPYHFSMPSKSFLNDSANRARPFNEILSSLFILDPSLSLCWIVFVLSLTFFKLSLRCHLLLSIVFTMGSPAPRTVSRAWRTSIT